VYLDLMVKTWDLSELENNSAFKNVYLVNAEPLGDAFTMIHMAAWQFHLLVSSSVCHLTNYTPVSKANSL